MQGNKNEALSNYLRSIETSPKNLFIPAHLNVGTLLFELKQHKAAIKHFDIALSNYAEAHKILVNKGFHLVFKAPCIAEGIRCFEDGQLQEALVLLQKALIIDDRNMVVHFFLGRSYEKLGDQSSAYTHYMQAKKLALGRLMRGKEISSILLKYIDAEVLELRVHAEDISVDHDRDHAHDHVITQHEFEMEKEPFDRHEEHTLHSDIPTNRMLLYNQSSFVNNNSSLSQKSIELIKHVQ
eukprot:TRINITY_DN7910_c0_g1_i1.p1 TRINITY_DN7910_c0_g1~~TRINITY_DN7910_c0_g1_i1.p1  ORF type:complete len:239 (+),score=50.01 TRINITY_DN7910_c0_g1_i1:211-927(+)